MTETLIILSVGLIVAAVMILREKPLQPRKDIAWSAVKLRSATHRSDGFTGVGWFIEGQPSA